MRKIAAALCLGLGLSSAASFGDTFTITEDVRGGSDGQFGAGFLGMNDFNLDAVGDTLTALGGVRNRFDTFDFTIGNEGVIELTRFLALGVQPNQTQQRDATFSLYQGLNVDPTAAGAMLVGSAITRSTIISSPEILFSGLAAGDYTLVIDGANNNDAVTGLYDVQVSNVPIPAAAWLFGSALLGLTGLKRRRNQTA